MSANYKDTLNELNINSPLYEAPMIVRIATPIALIALFWNIIIPIFVITVLLLLFSFFVSSDRRTLYRNGKTYHYTEEIEKECANDSFLREHAYREPDGTVYVSGDYYRACGESLDLRFKDNIVDRVAKLFHPIVRAYFYSKKKF